MLRKIIEMRGAITKITDAKAREARRQELNTALLDARKSHLPCIREDVRAITEDSLAVMSIAALDDTLIVPVILLILSDLKSAHEAKLSALLQALTGKDLIKEYKAKSMIDWLNSLLPKPIERLFEQLLSDKKSEQLTCAAVTEFISVNTTAACNALAVKAKIDLASLSAEFTSCISNELARACMHEIFQVTDSQQTASTLSTIFSGFSLSHDKIIKPYMALPLCVSTMKPELAGLPLYAELAVWFEGLHYYHYRPLRAKLQADSEAHRVVNEVIFMSENKPYPPVTPVDVSMYKLYGLTLYDLARHVSAAREELVKRLPAAQCEGDAIIVTVRVHGVFAPTQSAASAAAAAVSLGSDVGQVTQSAPNLNS